MIERAFRGAGLVDDVLDGGIVVALLIKQPPGGGNDLAFCVPVVFLRHMPTSSFGSLSIIR